MAIDMVAFAGVPPPANAPATTTGTVPPDGGDTFVNAIAAALAEQAGEASMLAELPAGFDLAGLIAALTSATKQQDVPFLELPQLDRDAEVEGALAALAALLLGVRAPEQVRDTAMPQIASGIALQSVDVVALPLMDASLGAFAGATAPQAAAVSWSAASVTGVIDANVDEPEAYAPGAIRIPADMGIAPGDEVFEMPTPTDYVRPEQLTAADPVPPAATAVTDLAQQSATVIDVALRASAADASTEPLLSEQHGGSDTSATAANPLAAAPSPNPTTQPEAVQSTSTIVAADGPGLASALAESVQAATLTGERELRIALNPPDLGQLTVQVTEHQSGAVSVSIQASSSEAHDLLQQQLPALRAGLEQREVRVEQLHVEQQTRSAGLGWTDSGNGRESQNPEQRWSNQAPEWSPVASMRQTGTTTAGTRVRTHDGSVDVRA
jgi:hypothetical protein